jgi:hypothetical protein
VNVFELDSISVSHVIWFSMFCRFVLVAIHIPVMALPTVPLRTIGCVCIIIYGLHFALIGSHLTKSARITGKDFAKPIFVQFLHV